MKYDYVFLFLLGMLPANGPAEASDKLMECADVANETERLACYDRETARIQAPASAAPVVQEVAPAAPQAATVATSKTDAPPANVDDFGKDEKMRREEREEESGPVKEIHAVIVSIEQSRYGKRTFTLDNGQVWTEKFVMKAMRLESGDTVRIKSGSLGSYKLYGSGKVSTKVERRR